MGPLATRSASTATPRTCHSPSSKQRSTLPNKPTRPWLESNSASLHHTQGDSVTYARYGHLLTERDERLTDALGATYKGARGAKSVPVCAIAVP